LLHFAGWLDNLAVSTCHIFVPWVLLPHYENMEKLAGKVRKVGTVLTNKILMALETVVESKTIPTTQSMNRVLF